MTSDEAMENLEKLYNMGLVSYPRTETNIFHKTIDLKNIVQRFVGSDSELSSYASMMLDPKTGMWGGPRMGKDDDKAHPPIHPVKWPSQKEMQEF